MKPLYLYFGFESPREALFIGLLMAVGLIINLALGFGSNGAFRTRWPLPRADRSHPVLFWSIAAFSIIALVFALAIMISASNALRAAAGG